MALIESSRGVVHDQQHRMAQKRSADLFIKREMKGTVVQCNGQHLYKARACK
jgi:hypothetical protein